MVGDGNRHLRIGGPGYLDGVLARALPEGGTVRKGKGRAVGRACRRRGEGAPRQRPNRQRHARAPRRERNNRRCARGQREHRSSRTGAEGVATRRRVQHHAAAVAACFGRAIAVVVHAVTLLGANGRARSAVVGPAVCGGCARRPGSVAVGVEAGWRGHAAAGCTGLATRAGRRRRPAQAACRIGETLPHAAAHTLRRVERTVIYAATAHLVLVYEQVAVVVLAIADLRCTGKVAGVGVVAVPLRAAARRKGVAILVGAGGVAGARPAIAALARRAICGSSPVPAIPRVHRALHHPVAFATALSGDAVGVAGQAGKDVVDPAVAVVIDAVSTLLGGARVDVRVGIVAVSSRRAALSELVSVAIAAARAVGCASVGRSVVGRHGRGAELIAGLKQTPEQE